jgi:hypothetical protein
LLVRNRLSFLDQSISDESEYPQDTFEELPIQHGRFQESPIPPESENMRNSFSRQLFVESGPNISNWNTLSSIVKKSGSLKFPIAAESENMRQSFSRQLIFESGSSISDWNEISSIMNKSGSVKISNLMKKVQEKKLVRNFSPQSYLKLSSLGSSRSLIEILISPSVLTSTKPKTKSKRVLWRIRFAIFIIGIRLGYLYKHVKDDYLRVLCANEKLDALSLTTQLKDFAGNFKLIIRDGGDADFNLKV